MATKTSLQQKAMAWFETNHINYWSVYKHPNKYSEGFRCQWIDGDFVNWIDDESQPPYKYRVNKRTDQSISLLEFLGINDSECRW